MMLIEAMIDCCEMVRDGGKQKTQKFYFGLPVNLFDVSNCQRFDYTVVILRALHRYITNEQYKINNIQLIYTYRNGQKFNKSISNYQEFITKIMESEYVKN